MTLQSGSDVILKIGDGGAPEAFAPIGNLRDTSVSLKSSVASFKNVRTGWQKVLDQAGTRSVAISAHGLFSDSAQEQQLRAAAFTMQLKNFELHYGNGDVLSGQFKVTSYERTGTHRGQEAYFFMLTSSDEILYTQAP